jgi:hypothetical protein
MTDACFIISWEEDALRKAKNEIPEIQQELPNQDFR